MVASAVWRPGRGGEADARSGRERRGACGCPLESRSGAVCQLEDQWIGDEPLSWQSQHSARRAGRRAADVGGSRHRLFTRPRWSQQIGIASCRDKVCECLYNSVVAVNLKKKHEAMKT